MTACISPYEFEVLGETTALVVDASLTTEERAHVVRLSLSENLDSTTFRSVSVALVTIIEGNQQIDSIYGRYVVLPNDINENNLNWRSAFFGFTYGFTWNVQFPL